MKVETKWKQERLDKGIDGEREVRERKMRTNREHYAYRKSVLMLAGASWLKYWEHKPKLKQYSRFSVKLRSTDKILFTTGNGSESFLRFIQATIEIIVRHIMELNRDMQ